jgi:hypothetical protein
LGRPQGKSLARCPTEKPTLRPCGGGDFSHTHPDDVDVLVVGPQGQNAFVMGDSGGIFPGVNSIDLTLDDTPPNYRHLQADPGVRIFHQRW